MDANGTLDALERRIERLEQQNRSLKRRGVAVIGLVSAVLLMAQAMPRGRVVEAEQFLVKDAAGETRAALMTDSLGGVLFFMRDLAKQHGVALAVDRDGPAAMVMTSGGANQVSVQTTKSGPSFVLYDTTGVARLHLSGAGRWGPSLGLYDESGAKQLVSLSASRLLGGPRLYMLANDSEAARIDLSHAKQGRGTLGLALGMDGSASITLARTSAEVGRASAERLAIRLDEEGLPSLAFRFGEGDYGGGGRPPAWPLDRIRLSLNASGSPTIALFDDSLVTRAAFGYTELDIVRTGGVEHRPASSLVFFDRDGKVIWKVP